MKGGLKTTPTKEEWLGKVLPAGSKVGVDAKLIAYEASKKMVEALNKNNNLVLELMDENLVDQVWKDRPEIQLNPIKPLPLKFSGRPASEKIASLQKYLNENNYSGFIVSSLDEIAWLFNLRGSDIPFNPLFFSYALVLADGPVTLYCQQEKVEKADAELASVSLKPYGTIFDDLVELKTSFESKKILIDTGCNAALAKAAGGESAVAVKQSPVMLEKAIKNEVELEGFRQCHVRDAAALVID